MFDVLQCFLGEYKHKNLSTVKSLFILL